MNANDNPLLDCADLPRFDLVAPEHLELLCDDPESLVPLVRNAGAIFCGPWSPASVGDYLAGPSHVLPTYGTARFASALTVDDFLKHHHVVTVDRSAYRPGGDLAEAVSLIAARAARWTFQHFHPADQYIGALAIEGEPPRSGPEAGAWRVSTWALA